MRARFETCWRWARMSALSSSVRGTGRSPTPMRRCSPLLGSRPDLRRGFYYSTILGSYIDNFALSMLRDGNNFDLNTFTSACVVNDLYGDFVFSASKATGINAVTDRDAGYLNVYPLITSGDITITATEEYAGKPLIIVDETGRLIFSRTLVGGDHFSYSFNHSGMYIVKAVGTNGYKKVIVK